jgi:hypothetical protein
MTKHTPGPWGCVDTSNHAHDYRLTRPNGSRLPVSAEGNDHSEQRANARLIAAAPSMLADLKRDLEFAQEVVKFLRVSRETKDVLFTSAEMRVTALTAAIAKAEGRT